MVIKAMKKTTTALSCKKKKCRDLQTYISQGLKAQNPVVEVFQRVAAWTGWSRNTFLRR